MLDPRSRNDETLRANLARLARERVCFGHQSVGTDIMEGVARLVGEARSSLRVVTATTPPTEVPPGTFVHELVGANGAPLDKLADFARFLGSTTTPFDIALVKLCYADIDPATNVRALFRGYRERIVALEAAHPTTTFVHVTVPLVVRRHGLEGLATRALGRNNGTADNARRDDYNTLLRRAYLGYEPIFDLARLESLSPDGKVTLIAWKGRTVPVLAPCYTDDGAHLNRAGQERAARELLAALAFLATARRASEPRSHGRGTELAHP